MLSAMLWLSYVSLCGGFDKLSCFVFLMCGVCIGSLERGSCLRCDRMGSAAANVECDAVAFTREFTSHLFVLYL